MPEFFPSFAEDAARPSDSSDLAAFLRGYMGAAEWLAHDDKLLGVDAPDFALSDERREILKGWTRKAQVEARRDCKDFLRSHGAQLARYVELTGRDMESAGYDFYLSRNGHGAGFFDRGNDSVFDELQRAARPYGEASAVMLRNGWLAWL